MINEKMLIEELKQREAMHRKDYKDFSDSVEAQFVVSQHLQELSEIMEIIKQQPVISETECARVKKPMIRHCHNCQWHEKDDWIKRCQVKYQCCDFPRVQALLCRFYKEKEEDNE